MSSSSFKTGLVADMLLRRSNQGFLFVSERCFEEGESYGILTLNSISN